MGLTRFTPDEPLLLWTDHPPSFGGGGTVVIQSLIEPEDRAKILWATPVADKGSASSGVVCLRSGSAGRGSRRSLLFDSTFLARRLADETLRLAADRKARALWVVLHGAGVQVAAELAKRRAMPLHVTVHDDPAFAVALRSRRYFALTPWVERQFAGALRGADSVDVIGEGMQARYLRRYGVNSVVVHRAISTVVTPAPGYDPSLGLRIGVLGNMYAYGQLPVLGRALARASRILGVPARIVMVGRGFADRLKEDLGGSGVDVESVGHVDETAAVEILRRCFAAYLNYPFGRRDAVLRETSFPTKLGTYVLAARPIVTHAPKNTTLAPLASSVGYVHPWTTMSEADGEELFVRMWRDRALLESAHVAGEALRTRYYDAEKNRTAIARALDALVRPGTSREATGQ
jgi:hypothetical protein